MNDTAELHGVILKHRPVGEYDWLVTLLTSERGRLNAFARGARRPGGRLSGNVEPFCFGTFFVYEGRSSYVIGEAKIDYFFETFRKDLELASYGTYFLEFAEYFSRENLEAPELCNLLYLTCRALTGKEALPHPLVRAVFELRTYVTEGILPGAGDLHVNHPALKQALLHITTCPLNRLYTFSLTEEPLAELCTLSASLRRRFIDRRLLSLDMLAMYESDDIQ